MILTLHQNTSGGPKNAIDVYDATGIVAGTVITVCNQSESDIYLSTNAADIKKEFVVIEPDETLEVSESTLKLWGDKFAQVVIEQK
jgi:hypothetical protein